MSKSLQIFNLLKEKQVIALLTPKSVEQCVTAYEVFSPLGVTLEIAFRSDTAMAGIQRVLEKYPDALILAGTVMTETQAEKAVWAGVAGIVSADYIPSVVEFCVKHDTLCVPGGLGDVGKQLSKKAELYGCEFEALREQYPYQWLHKLFPAMTSTTSFIGLSKAWKGPFKGLSVIYTGGVSRDNLSEIVRFDPDGIFCGSAMTRFIEDPQMMKEEAEKWLSIVGKDRE